jgi:hypothetical protein
MRTTLSLGLCFCLAACATSKPLQKSAPQSASTHDQVCTEVTPTGSMFSHTECHTRGQAYQERDGEEKEPLTTSPLDIKPGGAAGPR